MATTFVAAQTVSGAPEAPVAAQRYVALDAYRGLIMLLLVSGGLGFHQLPKTPFFSALAEQFEHRPWGGAVFYDLIMPAFLFMVGVAMPFSLGRRMEQGANFRNLLFHVAQRCLTLLLVSQVLLSIERNQAHLQFHNVLTQVAATYFICFLLMQLPFRGQAIAAVALLAGHSTIYLLFPGPDGAFQQHTNIGAVIDRAIMGQNYPWPCVNINFISEIAGVLFGVWTGQLLRGDRPQAQKLRILVAGMIAAFAAGLALSPVVPINKWLWTASYTLYTTGWVVLGLLAFYLVAEVWGIRKPLFPLVVVGMNSLFVYCVGELLHGWIDKSVRVFTGWFLLLGTLAPVAQAVAVLAVIWYLSYWLYRRRMFIKA